MLFELFVFNKHKVDIVFSMLVCQITIIIKRQMSNWHHHEWLVERKLANDVHERIPFRENEKYKLNLEVYMKSVMSTDRGPLVNEHLEGKSGANSPSTNPKSMTNFSMTYK